MYQTPQLQRFGSFRELTMVGSMGDSDGFPVLGNGGNDVLTDCFIDENGQLCCTVVGGGGPGAGRS